MKIKKTTISKEVRAHRLSDGYHKGAFYNAKNFCIYRYHCRKTNACGKIILRGIKCAFCPTCNQTCKDFVKERCLRLDRAPYVCNGCDKKSLTAQSPTSTTIMPDLPAENIAKSSEIPEPGST